MNARIIRVMCVLFIAMWIVPKCFLTRIEPTEIGVRRSLTGGISERDFELGFHASMPLVQSFYRLPRSVQYLDFNDEPGAEASSLEVRTRENNIIFVDVSVPWRIKDNGGWQIVREGFLDSYPDKVKSTVTGVLREGLAELTNIDITQPEKRRETAKKILTTLNPQLDRYHVTAEHVVIRGIRFRPEYEQKLQDKQYFIVQGKLDEAMRQQSIAVQTTETTEKTIEKDIALKREEWNGKIENLKTEYEIAIAKVEAETLRYDKKRRSEADAIFSQAKASGDLAEARADALGQRLKSQALASGAGRTYSAITAAENFELGEVELNSNDPNFLQRFGSMRAWREFFMGQ
ncbi:MAG: hypothetical protein A2138_18965 [Deltaproteobacteria bacterium RBG_16_71_12]|nr:MAG: hypothetical protein A2138_18965 [Deltaproteobacteria bacterium RBG_16_71_12]